MLWSSIGDGVYIAVDDGSSRARPRQKKRKASVDIELHDGTQYWSKQDSGSTAPKSSEIDDITLVETGFLGSFTPIPRCRVSQSAISQGGMGLRATVAIEPGEVIVAEKPFITVDYPPENSQIRQQHGYLSAAERLLFGSFKAKSATEVDNTISDIIANNVIPLGASSEDGEPTRSGMFRYICRINHSCVPNARWTWMSNRNEMELQAILPIRLNEEITACYLDDHAELFADRQAFLFANWGFHCTCSQCPSSTSKLFASDNRLRRYRAIRERYVGEDNAQNWEILGFAECWARLHEAIVLIEQEERYSELALCWESLFRLAMGWAELDSAIEAGQGWVRELDRCGDQLDVHELECIRNPEATDGYGRYLEVEAIKFAPDLESGGEEDFRSHWIVHKRRRSSRKRVVHSKRTRSQCLIPSA